MKLKMFRSLSPIWELRDNAEQNIPIYIDGNFDSFIEKHKTEELDIAFSDRDFDLLKSTQGPQDDIENSMIVFEKLPIGPRLAREQRLWTYLAHTSGLKYSRKRWPIPEPKAEGDNPNKDLIEVIRDHYVTTDNKRAIDRDNSISRLWMSAYIANQVVGLDLAESLSVLLVTTDFREGVVGRPTILKSRKLLNAVIHLAKDKKDNGEDTFFSRKTGIYLRWLEKINFEGGVTLFDALEQKEVNKLVEKMSLEAVAS